MALLIRLGFVFSDLKLLRLRDPQNSLLLHFSVVNPIPHHFQYVVVSAPYLFKPASLRHSSA
jgi:hypothetical protein